MSSYARFTRAAIPWAVAALLVTPRAEAQGGNEAAAAALFKSARELFEKGDYAAGCPKFEASFSLYPSASTMIHIAKCHEHDGKLATAADDYRRALELNKDTPGADRQRALEEVAKQGLAALDPRLAKLLVVVAKAPAGVELRVDGQPQKLASEAIALEKGPHEIVVSAPGHKAETRKLVAEEGKTASVEITLVPEPNVSGGSGGARPDRKGSLVPAFAAFGVGAVGLGVGAVTGIMAFSKTSDIESRCQDKLCPIADAGEADTVRSLGTISTIGFIVGGVGVAGGVVLFVMRPGGGGGDGSPEVHASAGLGRVELGGSF